MRADIHGHLLWRGGERRLELRMERGRARRLQFGARISKFCYFEAGDLVNGGSASVCDEYVAPVIR